MSRSPPQQLFPQRLVALVAIVAVWNSSGRVVADEPVIVGLQKQLLVDDHVLDETRGVTRELGQVTKANDGRPIFTDGRFYGTVLYDEGRFKLWFRKPGSEGYGYAESSDGLHFAKVADVTGISFAGDYNLAVEIDSHTGDPGRRFLGGYDAPGMAAGMAHSADGITWTPDNGGRPVTGRAADSYNQVLWDPLAQTYRLFTRTDFGTPGGATELRGTRSMTNADPQSQPTAWHTVRAWKFDREGDAEAQRRQIYAVSCWIYEGVYFALLSVYEHPSDFAEGTTTDHVTRHERDVMNFYVATSRDGDAWDLGWVYSGTPMIPRGPAGAFDKDLLLPASTIVTHDDRHWLYYAGANERHGNEAVQFERPMALGLATLPLDRFVGLSAGDEQGVVTTRPFRLEGDALQVNVDAHHGSVRINLLDEHGTPIPGCSASATGIDDIRWQPVWTAGQQVTSMRGKIVRLRFQLQNARSYAFQFIDAATERGARRRVESKPGLVFSVKRWEGEYSTQDRPGGVTATSVVGTICAIQSDGSGLREIAALGGNTDFPHPSPDGEWIYFQSNATGHSQIYRCRPDGSGVVNLTAGDRLGPEWADAYGYALSRDGRQLLYTVHNGTSGRVAVARADGADPRFVAPHLGYIYMAAFNPAGDRVVFSGPARGYRLLTAALPDGEPVELTPDHPESFVPQFTPDGRTLVFVRRDGDVYRVDADGGNLRRLTEGNGYGEFRLSEQDQHGSTDGPQISPTGGQVAYIAVKDGVPNVCVMDIDGSDQWQVTYRSAPCGRVRWRPDGTELAFVSFEGKYPQLFVVAASGGEPRQLTRLDGAVYFVEWMP
jgi:Tol biopolymer transport system component